MINSVDRPNVLLGLHISKNYAENMSMTPVEIDGIVETLKDFTERYRTYWHSFKVDQKNKVVNAADNFKNKIGIYAYIETNMEATDTSFLVLWNTDAKISEKPIDVWFARSRGVSGSGDEKAIKVHYLKIATMDHASGNVSSDTIAGRRIGDWTIDLNAKVILPLNKIISS